MGGGDDLISSGPRQGVEVKKHLKRQVRCLCHALLSLVSHSEHLTASLYWVMPPMGNLSVQMSRSRPANTVGDWAGGFWLRLSTR